MTDSVASIEALTRAVANLETRLTSANSKLGSLITPAGGAGGNAMSSALGSFTGAGAQGGGTGQILAGVGQVAAAAVTYGAMAMPDVTATASRSAAFYRSAITAPGTTKTQMGLATFNAMKGGISSPGGDAAVANYLTSRGVAYSADPNSEYMRMLTNTKNSAQYLGIDNMTSVIGLEQMTSGQGSAGLMASMGIYTSDPMSGKTRSESAIFSDIAATLTAGQSKMTPAEIMENYRKGNLGASLNNIGMSSVQQQKFLQFMINKAGGKGMDLESDAATKALMDENNKLGNTNNIQSTLDINTTMTSQMQAAGGAYETGMSDAARLFQSMNGHIEDLIATFGILNAQVQTYTATPTGAAQITAGAQIASGLGNIVNGITSIFTGGAASLIGTSSVSDTGNSGSMRAVQPTNGSISASYGEKGSIWSAGYHKGTDYAVADGTPVYAAAEGTVSADSVGSGSNSFGHYVTIDHGNGYKTLYAHLDPSSSDVHAGDTVSAGQVIGKSGHSGHATGPHLHFEVQKDGVSVDPSGFLSGAVAIDPSKKGAKTTDGSISSYGVFDNLFSVSASGFQAVVQSVGSLLGVEGQTSSAKVSSWSQVGPKQAETSGGTDIGGSPNRVGLGSSTISGARSSGYGAANVEINLNIAQASDQEARKFASLVKQILEDESLTSKMGKH